MTLNELLLNVKNTSFSSIVCQTAIQTGEDKKRYIQEGYNIHLTEAEFREAFPSVDPAHIYFSPSYSLMCFYYNPDTLAICPFHLDTLLHYSIPLFNEDATKSNAAKFVKKTLEVISLCEKAAFEGDFTSAITTLPDRMRLEFFTLLINKHGVNVPGLYKLFFDAYMQSDYGFNGMDINTLNVILQSKTAEDRKKTEEAIKDLPEVLTVYRGGNSQSTDYRKAYSWSLDINTANFFAAKQGNGPGYIAKAKVQKSDIIEAFLGEDGRGEDEVIVAPANLHVVEVIRLHGMDLLNTMLPRIALRYKTYRDEMKDLQFAQVSEAHGMEHQARVLLLTQILAELLELSTYEKHVLGKASIYHDTQRTHGGDDAEHGELAAKYYHETAETPDPLVEFLCKYHSLPDEKGYDEIRNNDTLSKNREKAELLFAIFKDADALDRVRFCIRDLDLNQLRLSESEELTVVARICYEQIKI